MFYFGSQQRIANISENFTYTVFSNSYYADISKLWASEGQHRPSLLSSNPIGVGIRHIANGAPMREEFYHHFNNMYIFSDIS